MKMRLIDADALKEEFAKHEDRKGYLIGDWEDIIDNAPTVPQVTVFAENASKEELENFKQELENVLNRPQGGAQMKGDS